MDGMTRRLQMFVSFWAYPLLGAALIYVGRQFDSRRDNIEYFWPVASGILLWTLIEYLLHRFVFHPRLDSARIERMAHELHGKHHRDPRDPHKILASISMSLPISALIFGAVWLGTGDLFTSTGVICGVWAGFLYYESVHYRLHTSNASGLLGYQRSWHFHHHFVNGSVCFGVTTPLWDAVFGTLRRK